MNDIIYIIFGCIVIFFIGALIIIGIKVFRIILRPFLSSRSIKKDGIYVEAEVIKMVAVDGGRIPWVYNKYTGLVPVFKYFINGNEYTAQYDNSIFSGSGKSINYYIGQKVGIICHIDNHERVILEKDVNFGIYFIPFVFLLIVISIIGFGSGLFFGAFDLIKNVFLFFLEKIA